MSLLVSRVALSLMICAITYFALHKVWTKKVDLLSLLKKPSEGIPVQEEPIIVSPKSILAEVTEWESETLFNVHNASGETLYTVWVKMVVDKPSFEHVIMRVTTDDGRKFVKPKGGEMFNADVLAFVGWDLGDQVAAFFLFRSLAPGEIRRFRLNIRSAPNARQKIQKVRFRLAEDGYGKEPFWVSTKGDAVEAKFPVPKSGFRLFQREDFIQMLEAKAK